MGLAGRIAAAAPLMPFLIAGAVAQDGPIGIAIVEAAEQGAGVCFSDNLDKGFACAKERCASESAFPQDCLRVRWCYPAGWSADIFVQNREGFHGHDYLCGWQDREELEAAIAVVCDKAAKPYLAECTAVRMWNNSGEEVMLE